MKKILILLCLALMLAGCSSKTQTGRSQLMMMSESEELSAGAQTAKEILKKAKLSTNQTQIAQIQKVGQNIAIAANKPSYNWEFYLIEEKAKNAFCLPGGKIFVYTGLMGIIADDDELAVVLGHEVAHALLRHGAEKVSLNRVQSGVGLLLNVAMAVLAPTYRGVVNTAYGAGSTLAVSLPYSRSHELEADKLGLELMARAGYDVSKALIFWQKMSASGAKSVEFLSTHPSDENRIKQIKELIK